MPDLPGRLSVDDVHLPQVLRRHRDVVVDIAGDLEDGREGGLEAGEVVVADLLILRSDWRGHIMTVERPVGQAVDYLDDVSVVDAVYGLLGERRVSDTQTATGHWTQVPGQPSPPCLAS